MRYILFFIVLCCLTACQVQQDLLLQKTKDTQTEINVSTTNTLNSATKLQNVADEFVGGVVVNQAGPIVLRERVSNQLVFLFPSASGQNEFQFFRRSMDSHYQIELVFSAFQSCELFAGAGNYNGFPIFSVRVLCADASGKRWSGNPILRHAYTADPSILVEGDTLYLYAGRDETSFFHANPARCGQQCPGEVMQMLGDFDISGIHIYKTQNMVDWEYLGPALKAKDTVWMQQTWASQIVKRGSKYYLYTSSPVAGSVIVDVALQSIVNFFSGRGFASGPTAHVGVAISDSPTGPFIDIGRPLISSDMHNAGVSIMDPAVLVDDDGQAYIYYGGGGTPKYAKLADNMLSLDGAIQDMLLADGSPMPGYTEGPYIHKRNGKYYFSYSTSKVFAPNGPLRYAMSDSPRGPWIYAGDLLGPVDILTNHGAIAHFKGRDYLFYHTGLIPGVEFLGFKSLATRAVSVDVLHYASQGKINKVEQTRRGVLELTQ